MPRDLKLLYERSSGGLGAVVGGGAVSFPVEIAFRKKKNQLLEMLKFTVATYCSNNPCWLFLAIDTFSRKSS